MTRIRRISFGVWFFVTVGFSVLYLLRPELTNPETLVTALRKSGTFIVIGYVALSVLRPVTLIPSTVLIVVGTLLFPDRYIMVFIISLSGVVTSAGLIYYFFDYLGLKELFDTKHTKHIRWLETKLQRRGFWIVVAWSAFPFVPTDAICYVAGTLRMHIGKFLLGVALGEIPIVAFYVTGGSWLFRI